jgi:hypothetical protein
MSYCICVELKTINGLSICMLEDLKFAWDKLFLFMLILSSCLIVIDFIVPINSIVLHAAEYIDLTILVGYYGFFIAGFRHAEQKLSYCKSHIWLIVLLIVPFVPFARVLRLQLLERVFKLGSNVVWHILDEIGML